MTKRLVFAVALAALSGVLSGPALGLTLTASGRFADETGKERGTWSGDFDVLLTYFQGKVALSGVSDVAESVQVLGSFNEGKITFGATKATGPQIAFEGAWSRDSGISGTFTYDGRTGTWRGGWGGVKPGEPAAVALDELAQEQPIVRELPAPLDLDPTDPLLPCKVLSDPRRMRHASAAGEVDLKNWCGTLLDSDAKSSREPSSMFGFVPEILTRFVARVTAQMSNPRANNPAGDAYPTISQNEVSVAPSGSGMSQNIIVAGYNDGSYASPPGTPTTIIGYARSTDSGAS